MTKTGTVTFYNEEEGYGFITVLLGDSLQEADAFFHISDYPDEDPQEGDRLKLSLVRNQKGWRAKNIKLESKSKKQNDPKGNPKNLRVQEIDPEYEKKTSTRVKKKSKKTKDKKEASNPFKNNTDNKNDLL